MFVKLFKKEKIYNLWNNVEIFEEVRQNIQQEILNISLNNELFISNIDNNNDNNYYLILNLGSGYCIWSKKILEKYNSFYIFNIDIIDYYKIKNNRNDETLMEFNKTNLKNEKLRFKNNSVYYIYNRDMITVYNIEEWDHVINEIYRVLKVDGFFEIIEYDVSIKHTTILKTKVTDIFDSYLINYLKNHNFEYNINILYNKINKIFETSINRLIIKLPLYYENKYEGKCFYNYILGLKHFKNDLDGILKSKINIDFDKSIDLLEEEIEQNKSYMQLNIIYGKKVLK